MTEATWIALAVGMGISGVVGFGVGAWLASTEAEREIRKRDRMIVALSDALYQAGLMEYEAEKSAGQTLDPDEIDWSWIGLPGGHS